MDELGHVFLTVCQSSAQLCFSGNFMISTTHRAGYKTGFVVCWSQLQWTQELTVSISSQRFVQWCQISSLEIDYDEVIYTNKIDKCYRIRVYWLSEENNYFPA